MYVYKNIILHLYKVSSPFVEKDRGNMYNPSPAKEIIEQGKLFSAFVEKDRG